MNRVSWGLVPVLAILLSTSLPGQSGEPIFNPYGLTEDTLDGLQIRDPRHRHFIEFFSALLLNQRVNREAASASTARSVLSPCSRGTSTVTALSYRLRCEVPDQRLPLEPLLP